MRWSEMNFHTPAFSRIFLMMRMRFLRAILFPPGLLISFCRETGLIPQSVSDDSSGGTRAPSRVQQACAGAPAPPWSVSRQKLIKDGHQQENAWCLFFHRHQEVMMFC